MMSRPSHLAGRVLLAAAPVLLCSAVASAQGTTPSDGPPPAKTPVQRELDELYRQRGMQAPEMSRDAAREEVEARLWLKRFRERRAREAAVPAKPTPRTAPATSTPRAGRAPVEVREPRSSSRRGSVRSPWRWRRNPGAIADSAPRRDRAPRAKRPSLWDRIVDFVRRDDDEPQRRVADERATTPRVVPPAEARPLSPSPRTIATQPQPRQPEPMPFADVQPRPERTASPTGQPQGDDLGNPFPELSEKEADEEPDSPFTGLTLDEPAPKSAEIVPAKRERSETATNDEGVDPRQRRIAERNGAGLKGFCPVALRDGRKLVDSDPRFEVEHDGHTYRVSSAEARDRFRSNPVKYAPVASGNDVILLTVEGRQVAGSLENAVWYKDRLHLFSSRETLAKFVTSLERDPFAVEPASEERVLEEEPPVIRIEPRRLPKLKATPSRTNVAPPSVGEEGSPFDEPQPFEVIEE